ncbi:unnamed protein product [Trichogramma brassicae]|uniref:Uncharacterized protein n=1 Tax=Trichogramma brassicae TaxID=86971 RepID=A0A6H5J4G5_9HYME|nr:unnamed protein product [Trichogramma brassicae]
MSNNNCECRHLSMLDIWHSASSRLVPDISCFADRFGRDDGARVIHKDATLAEIERLSRFGDPLLHTALEHRNKLVAELLLRRGDDPNSANDRGWTPLHVICEQGCDHVSVTWLRWFFELNDELGRQAVVHRDARDREGRRTPLHLALRKRKRRTAELLLRLGADPNSADAEGATPLHAICNASLDRRMLRMFFDVCKEKRKTVRIDARDRRGDTALHLALERYDPHYRREDDAAIALLLSRGGGSGSASNLANARGSTPLHIVCDRGGGGLDLLLSINEAMGQPIQVDARDGSGRTGLHLALRNRNHGVAETLLRAGADSNARDLRGQTPLHVVCQRCPYGRSIHDNVCVGRFFETCRELGKPVRVDALDNRGRTPLQLAVQDLMPDTVDALLTAGGADLSSFVFPTEAHFDECPGSNARERDLNYKKLELAFCALLVVERLEKKGYELTRGDALTIARLFRKLGAFPFEAACRLDNERFAEEARKTAITRRDPRLTLHDLLRLPPREAAKRITSEDGYEFAVSTPCEKFRGACIRHVFEIVARGFFLDWALEPFMELIHCRLPILCCQMIIDNLENKDLFLLENKIETSGVYDPGANVSVINAKMVKIKRKNKENIQNINLDCINEKHIRHHTHLNESSYIHYPVKEELRDEPLNDDDGYKIIDTTPVTQNIKYERFWPENSGSLLRVSGEFVIREVLSELVPPAQQPPPSAEVAAETTTAWLQPPTLHRSTTATSSRSTQQTDDATSLVDRQSSAELVCKHCLIVLSFIIKSCV